MSPLVQPACLTPCALPLLLLLLLLLLLQGVTCT
jgi:hypothetical protein